MEVAVESLFCMHANPKVAFLVARAVQRKPQKVDRLWPFTATLARIFLRIATKLDELGLTRFLGMYAL
jgi:hypothetical protein